MWPTQLHIFPSYTNYSLLNWSSTHKSNLKCIELKIKKAIRVLSFKNKYEHTVPLFKDHQILPFECQIKHKQAIFMWKLHNGYIPPPISELFTLNRSEVMLRIHPDRYHITSSSVSLQPCCKIFIVYPIDISRYCEVKICLNN